MAGIEDFFEIEETVEGEEVKVAATDENTEEEKPPETKEEAASEEEVPVVPEEEKETPKGSQPPDTIALLQRQLQEVTEELRKLQGQSTGLTKELTDAGVIDEDTVKNLEALGAVEVIPREKLELFEVLQETMRLSPRYADFDEVCSQSNFDLLVQTLAKLAVEEEGGKLTDKVSEVTTQIWSMANPYRFVYDTLKEHHPKFKAAPASAPAKVKEKETPPPSLSQIPGGSGSHRDGWTSAKIDALDEDELHKVPKEVYELYMRNELA